MNEKKTLPLLVLFFLFSFKSCIHLCAFTRHSVGDMTGKGTADGSGDEMGMEEENAVVVQVALAFQDLKQQMSDFVKSWSCVSDFSSDIFSLHLLPLVVQRTTFRVSSAERCVATCTGWRDSMDKEADKLQLQMEEGRSCCSCSCSGEKEKRITSYQVILDGSLKIRLCPLVRVGGGTPPLITIQTWRGEDWC